MGVKGELIQVVTEEYIIIRKYNNNVKMMTMNKIKVSPKEQEMFSQMIITPVKYSQCTSQGEVYRLNTIVWYDSQREPTK